MIRFKGFLNIYKIQYLSNVIYSYTQTYEITLFLSLNRMESKYNFILGKRKV